MKHLILGLAATSLAACATVSLNTSAVDRAQARYDQARAFAQQLLPYASPATAARIRLAGRIAEQGLAAARVAATLAEQRAALKRAEDAMRELDGAVAQP